MNQKRTRFSFQTGTAGVCCYLLLFSQQQVSQGMVGSIYSGVGSHSSLVPSIIIEVDSTARQECVVACSQFIEQEIAYQFLEFLLLPIFDLSTKQTTARSLPTSKQCVSSQQEYHAAAGCSAPVVSSTVLAPPTSCVHWLRLLVISACLLSRHVFQSASVAIKGAEYYQK